MLKKLKPAIPYILACLLGIVSIIPIVLLFFKDPPERNLDSLMFTTHILSFMAMIFGYIVYHSLRSKQRPVKILQVCLLFFLVAFSSMLLSYAVFWLIYRPIDQQTASFAYTVILLFLISFLLYCVCMAIGAVFLNFLYNKMVAPPTGKPLPRKANRICGVMLLISLLLLFLLSFTEWFNFDMISFLYGIPYLVIVPCAMLLLLPYSQILYGFPKKTVLWYNLNYILAIFSFELVLFSNYNIYHRVYHWAKRIVEQEPFKLNWKGVWEDIPLLLLYIGMLLLSIILSAALFLGISTVISVIRRKSENGWTSEKDQAP